MPIVDNRVRYGVQRCWAIRQGHIRNDSRRRAIGLRSLLVDVFGVLFGAMEAENAKSLTESGQHGRSHLLSLELRDQA